MIKAKIIPISELVPNTGQVKGVPGNPRTVTPEMLEKLKQSLKDDPEMLELNELKAFEYKGELIVMCGNQRLRASIELGLKELPVKMIPKGTTAKKLRAIIIKDNIGYGSDDWDVLYMDWDIEEIEYWGMVAPDELDNGYGEGFTLPDGDKSPFQQITFTLADEQATQIQNAIIEIKKLEEYKYIETFGNENSNGNAIYLIVKQWEGQKKYA